MSNSLLLRIKIFGARVVWVVTGRMPDSGSWDRVWAGSRRFAADRTLARDAEFERRDFDYDDAVRFLTGQKRGGARDVRDGSMPKPALDFISEHILVQGGDKPLHGLHIGDFVGVSLAHLTDTARRIHPGSVVVSIDPNVPHRGIDSPRDMVLGLMTRYRLEANWLPTTGFTLDRGTVPDALNRRPSATPFASFHGFSATGVLENLARLGVKFDFALIDGNHDGAYLAREIETLQLLLRPGALLFLDDVDENWDDVVRVFEQLQDGPFERIGHSNRVGVVRYHGEQGARPSH